MSVTPVALSAWTMTFSSAGTLLKVQTPLLPLFFGVSMLSAETNARERPLPSM